MGRTIRVRIRKPGSAAGAAALTVVFLLALWPAASPAAAPTPDGRVLVVINNLQEAYSRQSGDLNDLSEVKVFVKRLLSKVPFEPDVVLLQEVKDKSAKKVASLLTQKTNSRYALVVNPGHPPTVEYDNTKTQVQTDTGIVLNKTTMKVAKDGGYIKSLYSASASAPGEWRQIKKQAFLLAEERTTGMRMRLGSVHFTHNNQFKSTRVRNKLRGKWAEQLAKKLLKYPAGTSTDVSVIGGDFNMGRCVSGSFGSCKESAFYKILRNSTYNYEDPFDASGRSGGVDFIFTTGTAVKVGGDFNYDGDKVVGSKRKYYSDHQFRWAIIE